VIDRLPLIRERLSRSNPFSADRDDLLWALDEIERMRAARDVKCADCYGTGDDLYVLEGGGCDECKGTGRIGS
jgi:hypothetical protein